jgi:DNA-binding CsgD family transcriptional regulator
LGPEAIQQWPFDVARVRLSYGERLRSARADVEARRQLDLARATFERLRAHPWVARVDAQIQLTEMPAADGEMAGLTAKEYEVAQMAARGLTNKQIGAELFLSPRTVGTYLYRVYPKLGISTRAALRDALNGQLPTENR